MREQFTATKAVVSVSEMARMVGLSRSRFYQLVESGVFPQPVFMVCNRRPIYVESAQLICLEVRRRNCGVNGQAVLFYAKGHRVLPQVKPTRTVSSPPKVNKHTDLIDGLAMLGFTATSVEVEAALKALYPSGMGVGDQGQLLRDVFLFLKGQNSGDSVG